MKGEYSKVKEYKIRAFDKVRMEICKINSISFNDDCVCWIEVVNSDNVLRRLYRNQYEIMQSTGMYDKNKVEIFRGDIFFVSGEYDNGLYIEDRSGYVYVDYNEEYGLYSMRGFNGEWLDAVCDYLDSSVLEDKREGIVCGNIYQNKDTISA